MKQINSYKTRFNGSATGFFLLVGAVLFIYGGLSSCQSSRESGAASDSVLRKQVNERFEVRLEGCPTCGYSWFWIPVDSTRIRLLSHTIEPKNKDPRIVGGYATEIWTFVGMQQGRYDLEFIYRRPWEEEVQKKVIIRVIIH